ncbi:hypothetical protein VPH35_102681 [Triticum aestivum]
MGGGPGPGQRGSSRRSGHPRPPAPFPSPSAAVAAWLPGMASLPIPDELVQEILLRLPTPADLVRASASCPSFRLLVSRRSFLRRFRNLHAPPLLGFLGLSGKFFGVTPPSPSASAGSAVALAADFSFSFLPGPARDWKVRDVRGGRVLLDGSPFHNLSLVVCDPLHRRYLLLPPIPEFEGWLPSSVDNPRRYTGRQAFLGDDQEAIQETSFTVISTVWRGNKQGAFVFSSSTGQWRASIWDAGFGFFFRLWYANGCFFGVTECRKKLLALDTRRMEFSLSDLPPEAGDFSQLDLGPFKQCVNIAIVEAGEGITGMFVLLNGTSNISYLIRRNNGGSSNQWQMKTIPLDSSSYIFTSSTGRYLVIIQWGREDRATFTLDVKTFQLEKVFTGFGSPYLYRNFPPSLLSSPTISCGVENEAEETLEQGCAATPGLESQVRRAAQRECKSFYNRERPLIDNNCFL